MPKKPLRNFPREQPGIPWPSLQASQEDRSYVPIPESPLARRWRLMRASFDLLLLDMGLASLKGSMLGIFLCSVILSFITLYASGFCWLVGWHWQLATAGVVLSLLLLGLDLTLLIIAGIALWLSFRTMLTHPVLVLYFIGGGIALRAILELLPSGNPFRGITRHRRKSRRRQRTTGHRTDAGTNPSDTSISR